MISAAAGERIVAHVHRHRAGVARLAAHVQAVASLAGDRADDAQRLAGLFQHRPLLDMHLEIAEHVGAMIGLGAEMLRVGAEFGEGRAHGHAVRVDEFEDRRIDRAGNRR